MGVFLFFFFKQKTAYEMRISDWSSDVCSSDLSSAMTQAPPPFVPGAFVGAAHHYRARVYFEDTDLSGIVYHANSLRYMERARSDMLRLAGIHQRAGMEAGDGAWPGMGRAAGRGRVGWCV